MSKPQITENARRNPGRCAISRDIKGPFLDTGENIPGFGHVYLSMRFLKPLLREQGGFVPAEDIEDLKKENQELRNENDELRGKEEHLNELIEAVTPYLPKPEPELVPRTVVQERDPTDEEIQQWIAEHGADHRVVRAARRVERGSTEQWNKLYEGTKVTQPAAARQSVPSESELSPAARARAAREEDEESPSQDVPEQNVELYNQTVDLDVLLSQNVDDVNSFVEGKPESFVRSLVEREFHLRELEEKDVRKGILQPLGYWDEDTDEPLHPRELSLIEEQESEEDAGEEGIAPELAEQGEVTEETEEDETVDEEEETVEEEDTQDSEEEDEENVDLSDLDEEDEDFSFSNEEDEE